MGGRKVISEQTIREAARAGQSSFHAPPGAIVTPLAADFARSAGINILFSPAPEANQREGDSTSNPVICIGSDHGGYALKSDIIEWLKADGHQVVDLGTDTPKSCDYPDFAYAVAAMVAEGRAGRGIMIDGVGVGSAVVCNKVPGIRAACAYNEFAAWNARAHNDCNVLTLGSRSMGIEVVRRIVNVFLDSEFEGGRHARRVDKMTDIEERFSRR
ncbi:MAG: ribose 5-phosphate isomerase B [Bacteroidetes bacterium]|nr:ribose 5-phosphate isomerase B [Bacteroidota bacterium]